MAKKSLWQRIRSWFRGDEKKSAPKPRQNRDARNETVSTRTSAPSYNRRALLNSLRDKKAEEEENRVKEAFKATKYDTKDIGESLKKTVKKDVPDPKEAARKKSQEQAKATLKREKETYHKQTKEFNERTNHEYDVKYWKEKGNKEKAKEAAQKVKSGDNSSNAVAEELAVKYHPKLYSATRGAASGATFGASDLMLSTRKGKRAENEKYYQEHKSKGAEMAGEIVGSLASFGGTAKATDRLGEKVIEKAAPRAAEKLAGTKLIQNAAKKSVTKAVEKGAVKSASKELIEQVGKDRAKKIVNAVGNDVVQNATTGLLYDFNKASAQHEIGSPEWWREMGQSAAFNAAITGVVGAGSAFTGGKRLVKEAAENLTPRYKVGLNRRRRGDVVLPNERPSAAISEAKIIEEVPEATAKTNNWMDSLADSETYDGFVKQNAKNTDLKAHMKETGKAPKEIWRDARIERGKQNLRRISDEEADRILYEKIPENEIQGWFNDANSGYKPRILERMAESPDTVNASLNVAYKNYLDSNPKNALPFDEWLDTPQTLYRGVRSQTKTADDIFSAFTPYKEEVAKKFAGKTGSIEEISITPRETYGSVMHNLESEFLVPESAIKETAIPAPKSEGFERYAERTAKQERMMQEGGEKADAIRAELANKPAKGAKPAAERLKSKDVDQFAGIKEDVSDMGFDAESEKLYQAANDVDTGKSSFDKLKDEAYKQSGTGLSTDGKEQMTAGEAREFFDSEWRTTQEHTKRGFSTIAVTGDKGFKGIAHDALKNGETVIDVYHDKENLAAGAQRVMSKADQEGGINQMIKDFNDYASNKLRLTENERRDQIYDCIAAVDFANANKDQPWSGELFLAACRAGAEQTSGSGLSLHMWHKMAMSSPAHRAKAVREQILDMFNRSAGMRKALNKGKGDKIKIDELDDVLKKNPALQKVLEELDNMDAATSKDEVERVASRALLHARKAMPMTVLDQLTQWRYVAMLSSPKTHIRNITSNIYSATLGQLRDAIASSAEENLIKGKGKYGKKFQEAVDAGKIDESNYHKSAGGLSWKAFSDSHTGTKSGFTLNRLNSKLEKTRLELEATSAKDATKIERLNSRIKDLEARQKEAQKAYDKAIAKLERGEAKKALDSWNGMGKEKLVANAEKWERRQYNGTVSKGVFKMNDKMSNFIGNALETSDALSLERIYREKFDKILTANDWSGLSKKAAGGDQEAAAALKQLEEYASQEAAYTAALDTYRNYNALSSAMNKFVNDSLFNYDAPIYKKVLGAGLHAIMPFTKVPVNLLKRGIDYSPVGLMTAKRNLTRAIESGNITEINRACERLAEGKIGTGIVALGAGLGFADPDGDLIMGRLHDTDYIDKKKKDAGYQNYSVTLGDHNFTLDWATPTAASMFTGVEFGRMLRHAFDQIASDEGVQFNFWKAFDVPLILASTTLEPTLQLGVFQGINDTLESVVKSDNYDDSGTNVNPALKIVASIAGNYVNSQISPAILSQLSRSFSPYDYFVTGETDPEYAFTQQLAKTPLAGKYLGAKTNVWGQIKNEKTDAGDYAKAAAKNLLSPANINKVTWDETDEWAKEFYEKTGYQGAFPKNNYNKTVEVGRIKGAHTLEMTKKEMAEYNVQRGKSGEDAMRDALNTVVFNRYDKDSQGHRTIAHADNISPEEREKIAKQFAGKGIKEVVDYIRKTPQFKKATVAEQKQILDAIYGASGGDDDQAKGAKRSAQRYIAGKKGISANEYDYYNETPRRVQESLQEAIDSGLITYEQALDFTRNAGKTYYTTDERGEKGGTVTTNYNKKEMMEYLSKKGYSYEEAEALYNAYKQANAKDFNGIDLSSGGRGYRRRYGGYRHYGGGGRSKKVPALKQSSYKATKRTYKDTAATLKTSSSRSNGLSTSPVKVEPPKVKFKKYEV